MNIKSRNAHFILLAMLISSSSTYAQDQGLVTLSLKPFVECKKPPRLLPPKFLNKKYTIQTNIGPWQIVDINGDGWCDWVRGGPEAHRRNVDEPLMRDFIYLGTPNGWRGYGEAVDFLAAKKRKARSEFRGLLPNFVEAFNFFEPMVIFSNQSLKPYIAFVSRPDAPAPYPKAADIMVARWDDRLDTLQDIPESERLKAVAFLRRELCKTPPASTVYSTNGYVPMIAQEDTKGYLCEKPLTP